MSGEQVYLHADAALKAAREFAAIIHEATGAIGDELNKLDALHGGDMFGPDEAGNAMRGKYLSGEAPATDAMEALRKALHASGLLSDGGISVINGESDLDHLLATLFPADDK